MPVPSGPPLAVQNGKHVNALNERAEDAGSTPAASTIYGVVLVRIQGHPGEFVAGAHRLRGSLGPLSS